MSLHYNGRVNSIRVDHFHETEYYKVILGNGKLNYCIMAKMTDYDRNNRVLKTTKWACPTDGRAYCVFYKENPDW